MLTMSIYEGRGEGIIASNSKDVRRSSHGHDNRICRLPDDSP